MLMSNSIKVAIISACVVLSGCALNRSEIELSKPVTAASAAPSAKTVVIRSIKDERVFEQSPRNPSTPSLGFEGANQATAELKARAVGRKRNGYGQALGDVVLKDGQTVESVIREHLGAALALAGYQVTSLENAGNSPVIIDVSIRQFWAWLRPSFMTAMLNANIETDLAVSGAAAPISIQVNTYSRSGLATDSAWMEIIDQALTQYRAQVIQKAGTLP